MTEENKKRVRDAYVTGDCVGKTFGATVCFEWGLVGAGGAWFTLLREPHHTDEEVRNARRELRRNRDVLSTTVETLE